MLEFWVTQCARTLHFENKWIQGYAKKLIQSSNDGTIRIKTTGTHAPTEQPNCMLWVTGPPRPSPAHIRQAKLGPNS